MLPRARPPHIAGIPGLASWDPTLERNQAAREGAGSEQGVLGRAEALRGGRARPGALLTHERGHSELATKGAQGTHGPRIAKPVKSEPHQSL